MRHRGLVVLGLLAACSSQTAGNDAADMGQRDTQQAVPDQQAVDTSADISADLPPADASAAFVPEEPGPFPVGKLDDAFTHAPWGNYLLTVYYPATTAGVNAAPDKASAPYPAVVFAHGYLGNKDANIWVGTHLASRGYVCLLFSVPNPGEASVSPWAEGISGAIDHLTALTQGTGPLAGMVDLSRIGVSGHSKGANATIVATAADTRIRAAVPLAFCASFPGEAAKITVPVQLQPASLDGICSPALSTTIYGQLAPPKMLLEIAGANHIGFLGAGMAYDAARLLVNQGMLPDLKATISRAEQERLSRKYMTAWFSYYLEGNSEAHTFLYGAEAAKDRSNGKLSQLAAAEK